MPKLGIEFKIEFVDASPVGEVILRPTVIVDGIEVPSLEMLVIPKGGWASVYLPVAAGSEEMI